MKDKVFNKNISYNYELNVEITRKTQKNQNFSIFLIFQNFYVFVKNLSNSIIWQNYLI
jgi:hypothetical protein